MQRLVEIGVGIMWLVSFNEYVLGCSDEEENRVEPVGYNPFVPKVFPMWPVSTLDLMVGREGFEPSTIGLKAQKGDL